MVIKFDIPTSVIPENSTITEAVLSLYAHAKYKSNWNNDKKYLYKLTQSWNESSVTYKNKPSYNNQSIANSSNTSIGVWETYDVTDEIIDIVENNEDNYGFLLKMQEYSYRGVKIRSSESSNSEQRPKLTITYETQDTEPPEVTLTSPDGGEVWKEGTANTITWDATDNVSVVSCALYYCTDARATWKLIKNINGNPGTLSCTVPNAVSKTCKIKVEAADAAGNKGSDESDQSFTIDPMTGINQNILKVTPYQKHTVTVTNIQGRAINTFKTDNLKNLDRVLPSGVHIIHITTPDKRLIRKYSIIK